MGSAPLTASLTVTCSYYSRTHPHAHSSILPDMAQVHKGDVNGIPIVSLASFMNGSNKQAVAEAMLDSFKTIGFVYLVDHGLSKDKIDGMFDWVSIFYQP